MFTLKTVVLVAAALGVASAKKTKRQCAPSTSFPTPTPTQTEQDPSGPTEIPPPSGGGGGQIPTTGEYSQTHDVTGEKWFEAFEHWGYPDPTNGRVTYVDENTARSQNLSYASGDKFFMRTDSTNVLDPNGPGRQAVRIQSRDAFSTFTAVMDIQHMPEGMGTWPAYWTCGDNWPAGGELDIVEYVSDGNINLSSLHTGDGCTQPDKGDSRPMKGNPGYWDCNAYGANGNQGCGVSSDSPNSSGPNFNSAGGGWYAVERTDSYIKVWFWGRNDPNVPSEVANNYGVVSPSQWGTPTANFVSDSCNIGQKFGPNKFIINLTYCGDWAGNAYPGGIGACNDFVNNNPQAFQNAYWEINRLNIYGH